MLEILAIILGVMLLMGIATSIVKKLLIGVLVAWIISLVIGVWSFIVGSRR